MEVYRSGRPVARTNFGPANPPTLAEPGQVSVVTAAGVSITVAAGVPTGEKADEIVEAMLIEFSMGELGTSPESLEGNLQDILDLCVPWGALVLIDEAEMLLESYLLEAIRIHPFPPDATSYFP